MSTAEPVIVESDANGAAHVPPQRLSLLDRMDSSIGEVSAGIGSLLTELVRRSLRGGVSNIDHHLEEFAHEQVQTAVERQLPLVRTVANEVAGATSREIAQTAVARIAEETETKTQHMATSLQATDRRLTDVIASTEAQIRETTQAVHSTVERLQEETRKSTTQLEEKLVATKQETDVHLQSFEAELRENAKRSWQKVNQQLDELRGQTAVISTLTERLTQADAARQQLEQLLKHSQAEYRQAVGELHQQLETSVRKLETTTTQCQSLTARLDELERPRGFRAWLARLRGGSSKKLTPPPDEADDIAEA